MWVVGTLKYAFFRTKHMECVMSVGRSSQGEDERDCSWDCVWWRIVMWGKYDGRDGKGWLIKQEMVGNERVSVWILIWRDGYTMYTPSPQGKYATVNIIYHAEDSDATHGTHPVDSVTECLYVHTQWILILKW